MTDPLPVPSADGSSTTTSSYSRLWAGRGGGGGDGQGCWYKEFHVLGIFFRVGGISHKIFHCWNFRSFGKVKPFFGDRSISPLQRLPEGGDDDDNSFHLLPGNVFWKEQRINPDLFLVIMRKMSPRVTSSCSLLSHLFPKTPTFGSCCGNF